MLPLSKLALTGAILAGLAVALGAFGAHALRPSLEAAGRLDTYEKAVAYQMYHALALLALPALAAYVPEARLSTVGLLWVIGVLIFSGSLYVLCLTGIRWMGAITPIGGVAFIAGWVWLAASFR